MRFLRGSGEGITEKKQKKQQNKQRFLKQKNPEDCYPRNFGADGRTRTGDLLITNQLLYQLSHTSGAFAQRMIL